MELSDVEKSRLVEEIKEWPEYVAEWKGKSLWESVVVGFCEGKLGEDGE